jgi:hypothetical protein
MLVGTAKRDFPVDGPVILERKTNKQTNKQTPWF